ncbi:MAG: tyrosine-type recombinase/integrase [Mycobacteriaceae bacterium]
MLAVHLGLRRGELLGLRWDDVDLDKERLQVVRILQRVEGELRFMPPKTRHSRRTVPLPAPCVEALRRHRVAQDRERLAAENWTVEQYLAHWLVAVVRPNRAPKTYQGYELAVRRHVVPVLGRKRLKHLSVTDVRGLVQTLNDSGMGTRMVQYVHAVLRNALEHAVCDEAIPRNVARLVQVVRGPGFGTSPESRRLGSMTSGTPA